MKTSIKATLTVLLALTISASLWYFGPWRVKSILDHGMLDSGERFCVAQLHKDCCRAGWYIGLYLTDSTGTWRLRWIARADEPWTSAKVDERPVGISFQAKSTDQILKVTSSDLYADDDSMYGWSSPPSSDTDQLIFALRDACH